MIRRILLVAGTFAVLLLAYLAYDYFAGRDQRAGAWPYAGPGRSAAGDPTTVPGVGVLYPGAGEKEAQYYDRNNNLKAVFTWEEWKRIGRTVHLTRPRLEWYLRDGQTVVIQAKRGLADPTDVGGRWEVRQGQLEGDVLVVLDRGTAPDRPPLAERPADAVRIHLQDAYFDRDRLTIRSKGPVILFSREADIIGEGLRIDWTESPRQELREFRIERGQWLSIRGGGERFLRRMRLPGGMRARAEAGPVGAVFPRRREARAASVAVVGRLPTVWLAPLMLAATQPVSTSAPALRPETTAAMGPPVPLPTVQDTYVATFSDNVNVDYAEGYLHGADKLELIFELKRQQLEELGQSPTTRATAEQPTTRPDAAPGPPPPVTTAPADAEDSLTITWEGPLVVKPLRGGRKPIADQFDVAAGGRRLELADAKTRAVCQEFDYQSHLEQGKLVGTPRRPVKIEMADGAEISAPRIRFDGPAEVIHLDGAGRMHRPQQAGKGGPERPEAEELTITWTKSVEVSFGQKMIPTQTGEQRLDYVRQATFLGDVNVRQGDSRTLRAEKLLATFYEPQAPAEEMRIASLSASGAVHLVDTQSGEFIKARELDVVMSPSGEARMYPRRVSARGKVSAHQEEADVTNADALEVTFKLARDKKTGKLRLRPQKLEASGAVVATMRGDDGPVHAEAEELVAKLAEGTATLVGKPAKVTLKDKVLQGENIFVTQRALADAGTTKPAEPSFYEEASVTGPGELSFYTDEDISGNKTAQPIPVAITWTKSLVYDGAKRLAVISGDVELKMGGDRLACEKSLTVEFLPPEETPATAPSSQPAKRRPRLEQMQLSSRKIKLIRAEKKAEFESVRKDDEGFLLGKVNLTSEELVYDGAADKITCDKPGKLVVEDYRVPEKRAEGKRPAVPLIGSEDVSGPSQSVFKWEKSMSLQKTGGQFVVTMAGAVAMWHRSGREMVLLEKLNVRPWGELPAGRNLVLSCEDLLARFSQREEATTRPAAEPRLGSRVGRLELFEANEDVRLAESTEQVRIFCYHMLYRRETDVAIIAGASGRDAVVTHYDRTRRRQVTSQGPAFIWNPKAGSFKARAAEVIGGR